MSDASTNEVWERLRNTYQREYVQSQLRVRIKLHALQLGKTGDIQSSPTLLEEIFVNLARINNPVIETDKSGILLLSLPKSLSLQKTRIKWTSVPSWSWKMKSLSQAVLPLLSRLWLSLPPVH